jgi:hypothetical protein
MNVSTFDLVPCSAAGCMCLLCSLECEACLRYALQRPQLPSSAFCVSEQRHATLLLAGAELWQRQLCTAGAAQQELEDAQQCSWQQTTTAAVMKLYL